MDKKAPRREGSGSAEESAERPLTKTEAAQAMDRFKSLTRGLLNVSNAALKAELEREKGQKANPSKRLPKRAGRNKIPT